MKETLHKCEKNLYHSQANGMEKKRPPKKHLSMKWKFEFFLKTLSKGSKNEQLIKRKPQHNINKNRY
jgi:hypothetical protein